MKYILGLCLAISLVACEDKEVGINTLRDWHYHKDAETGCEYIRENGVVPRYTLDSKGQITIKGCKQ